MSFDKLKKYNLPVTAGNLPHYESVLDRLRGSGFEDKYIELTSDINERHFLEKPLLEAEKNNINSIETPLSAAEAEIFQDELLAVPVQENGEGFVDLDTLGHSAGIDWSFSALPYHEACGEWAGKSRVFWVRHGLGSRLASLADSLATANYTIHFEDAFRPLGVQEGLFKRRYAMAQDAHPEWSEDKFMLEAKSKTAYTARYAAHKAGAAVDVRLRDDTTGDLLDIGHNYPDGGEIVRLDSPFVTQEQWQNRKILQAAAYRAGLLMYPFEDWHLCFGDVTAAAVQGGSMPAIYGPIKDFSDQTGEIITAYGLDEIDNVFTV